MKRFSDFAKEEKPLDGEKIKIDDLLNKEVIVKDFKIAKSKYEGKGDYMTLQVEENGETRVSFTGSSVLINQCKKYQDEMPFQTVIKKVERYYTFS